MDKRRWLILATFVALMGCSEDGDKTKPAEPDPGPEPQVGCDPACTTGYECVKGECIDATTICKPECNSVSQKCVNNQCVYEAPYCMPGACTIDHTQACPADKENPKWETCSEWSTCEKGKCKLKNGYECEPGVECIDDDTMCKDGHIVSCQPGYETCVEGACKLNDSIPCDAGTCISGAEQFYCTSEGFVGKCKDNERCNDGACIVSSVPLWDVCTEDTDCPDTKCLKQVPLATADGETGDFVSLHDLDPRISEGQGLCAADCSADANRCGISGACQVLFEGISPWPSSSPYPLTLDEAALAAGVPFAAICRPDVALSPHFCEKCEDDSACDDGFMCVGGECLLPCESDVNCPYLFSCLPDSTNGKKVCMPVDGFCGACYDSDGDGYGVGHCSNAGIDCDDSDSLAHLTSELPEICDSGADRNCNGIYDASELLGTDAHCSACNDACDSDTESCINGSCQFRDDFCQGGTCSDDFTHACPLETVFFPVWKKCESYEICSEGSCVLKEDYQCAPGICIDGNSACSNDGLPVKCVKTYEKCEAGECKINSEVSCTPGTCFEDTDDYFCNASKEPEKCDPGNRCQNGQCIPKIDTQETLMWRLCVEDEDCPVGQCIKSVLVKNQDQSIVLNALDARIPEGKGLCTYDCANNPGICDTMTTGDVEPWSCQTIYEGTSPWPSSITYPAKDLDLEAVEAGVPFAAVCRPRIDLDTGWSGDFCKSCSKPSECGDGYQCVSGSCLSPCENDTHCPYLFSCRSVDGASTKVCRPVADRCGDCYDLDGDGSGIGNCANPGTDCNDSNPNVFFSPGSPDICGDKQDRNCNGMYDDTELLGTDDHCSACYDKCSKPTDADNHIASGCKGNACERKCEDGYAECATGNIEDGCTKIIHIEPAAYKPQETVTQIWGYDYDKDHYADENTNKDVWCCGSSKNICYAFLKNEEGDAVWTPISNPATFDRDGDGRADMTNMTQYAARDCNDRNASINPDASVVDVPDGLDNNCNGKVDESYEDLDTPCTNYATLRFKTWESLGYLQLPTDGVSSGYGRECSYKSVDNKLYLGHSIAAPSDYLFKTEGRYQSVLVGATNGEKGRYEKRCIAAPFVSEHMVRTAPEYCDGLDNNGDGMDDADGIVSAFPESFGPMNYEKVGDTCPSFELYEIKNVFTASEQERRLKCENIDDAYKDIPQEGICNFGRYICEGDGVVCRRYVAEPFDFIGDNTDTNCDGFEGDLNRTLFVALDSQSYGSLVKQPTDDYTPDQVRGFSKNPDLATGMMATRPFASLGKALEIARTCMQHYNAAGCSQICYDKTQQLGRGTYYCDTGCPASDPNCESFLIPWDIVMTDGKFEYTDKEFDLTYPTEPDLLNKNITWSYKEFTKTADGKDIYNTRNFPGWQKLFFTTDGGYGWHPVIPSNAAWRIFGGAQVSSSSQSIPLTWLLDRGTTEIKMYYTNERYRSGSDITSFYSNSNDPLHLYFHRLNITAEGKQKITADALFEGRSPATMVGIKALNAGRMIFDRTTFLITAPSGVDAPATPQLNTRVIDGSNAVAHRTTVESLFKHPSMRNWQRHFDANVIDTTTLKPYVCPNGESVSAGGAGAVSPYTKAAYEAALDAVLSRDAAGYYCPAADYHRWYIYNYARQGGPDITKNTGLKWRFIPGQAGAPGPYLCAQDGEKTIEATLEIPGSVVNYPGTTCFGGQKVDNSDLSFVETVAGGKAGVSGKFDSTPMELVIERDNFNFRSKKNYLEMSGTNGGNGIGGVGAPAFTTNTLDDRSIVTEFAKTLAYPENKDTNFCGNDHDHYSRMIAQSLENAFLASIHFGYGGAGSMNDNDGLILQGAGGGAGGCGGLGGAAGIPGGSAIGMILGSKVDLQFTDSSSYIRVTGGNGGKGADGRDGSNGGRGGGGLSFSTQAVQSPITNRTFSDITLKPMFGQSGSAGGGGGAGAAGKPGYGLGVLIDCSWAKSFEDCNIAENKSIKDLDMNRILTVKSRTYASNPTAPTDGADAPMNTSNVTPVATTAGRAGKIVGNQEDYSEIINGRGPLDTERVYSYHRLVYLYNENNIRVIGSNDQQQ